MGLLRAILSIFSSPAKVTAKKRSSLTADRRADLEDEAAGIAEDTYYYLHENGECEFDGADLPEDMEAVIDDACDRDGDELDDFGDYDEDDDTADDEELDFTSDDVENGDADLDDYDVDESDADDW